MLSDTATPLERSVVRGMLAGLLGALACLTRITGIILLPVMLLEALEEYRAENLCEPLLPPRWLNVRERFKPRRTQRYAEESLPEKQEFKGFSVRVRRFELRWLWIAIIPAGFIAYLILNMQVTGDPFSFLAIQKEFWNKAAPPPWVGINGVINSVWWRSPGEAQIVGLQELIFVALGLVCTIYCWAKLRRSYGVWMAGNWLIFTSTALVYSVPRYTLTLFPIFILFAQAAQRRLGNSVITVWSLIYLGLFTTLFRFRQLGVLVNCDGEFRLRFVVTPNFSWWSNHGVVECL